MNVLIVPSWYPTSDHPITGVFFKEQAKLLALHHPQHQFCVSLWGSHDISLLLTKQKLLSRLFGKYRSLKASSTIQKKLLDNCFEHYTPAYTWTRYLLGGNMKNIIAANRKNAELFEAEFGKTDIIYAHVGYPAGYIALQLSRQLNCPYVISEHMGPFPFPSYLNILGKPIPRLMQAYKSATQVLSVSTSLQKTIEQKISINTDVLPNFIDEQLFKINSKPPKKNILFVGRAESDKGLDLLIRAFYLSQATAAGYQLQVIGAGTLFEKHQDESLPDITFLGEIPNTQIPSIISDSSFLVLPSIYESFGVVLLEAIACGKPILATDCGGPSDIVTPTNGVLAKKANLEDLQEKLDWMIANHHSFNPEDIRKEFLEKFGSKKVATQLMSRFEQIVINFATQNISSPT
jgi:glycosyltransferase involved in cell wall biosynthesis